MTDFAYRLEGLRLAGGWQVSKRLTRRADATGGNFSVGYEAVDAEGRAGFLKAIDIARAFGAPDFVSALAAIAAAHRDECALLDGCRGLGLDRVVWSIAHGFVQVDATSNVSRVPYIIFEMADADLRTHERFAKRFDVAWAARTLHHVAVGLNQLHGRGIAHQDVKPSNIMMFDSAGGAKLGDLGCASQITKPGHRDALSVAGDPTYAPPEHLYRFTLPDWRARRLGGDLYNLGSVATFLFAKAGMTELVFSALPGAYYPGVWRRSYADVLPFLQRAYAAALSKLEPEIPSELRSELLPMITYLCDPDPLRRGHPRDRAMKFGDPHSLQRFVATLDVLARKAERGLRTFASAVPSARAS